MLDTAIIGMGRWGQTLVDSVQGKNDAGIRFVAGCTGRPERAATGPRGRACASCPTSTRCWRTRR